MMYDLRCNAGGARPVKVIFWDKAHGLEQSTSLKCPCFKHNLNKGEHKVNTTMIKRKRIPDSGIEPETSVLPGSVQTFTRPGLLRNPMIELL